MTDYKFNKEKAKKVYDTISENGGMRSTESQFYDKLNDESFVKNVYQTLKNDGIQLLDAPDEGSFLDSLGFNKHQPERQEQEIVESENKKAPTPQYDSDSLKIHIPDSINTEIPKVQYEAPKTPNYQLDVPSSLQQKPVLPVGQPQMSILDIIGETPQQRIQAEINSLGENAIMDSARADAIKADIENEMKAIDKANEQFLKEYDRILKENDNRDINLHHDSWSPALPWNYKKKKEENEFITANSERYQNIQRRKEALHRQIDLLDTYKQYSDFGRQIEVAKEMSAMVSNGTLTQNAFDNLRSTRNKKAQEAEMLRLYQNGEIDKNALKELYNLGDLSERNGYLYGLFKTGKAEDMLTFGMNEIARNMNISEIVTKVKNGTATSEEIGVLDVYSKLDDIKNKASKEYGFGFTAGMGTQTSLRFIAEAALTGGLEAVGKNFGVKGTKELIEHYGLKEAGKQILNNSIATAKKSAARQALLTPAAPSMYVNYSDRLLNLNLQQDNVSGWDKAKSLYNAYVDTFTERYSETLGNIVSDIPVFTMMTKGKATKDITNAWIRTLSRVSDNEGFQQSVQALRSVGITGIPGEVVSELSGNVMNGILNLDPEQFKVFTNRDFYKEVALNSIVMAGVGGAVSYTAGGISSIVQSKKLKDMYEKSMERMRSTSFGNDRLDALRVELMDAMARQNYVTTDESSQQRGVADIVMDMNAELEALQPADPTNTEQLAAYMKAAKAMDIVDNAVRTGAYKYGEMKTIKSYVQDKIGEFENEDGNVYEFTDNQGKQYFILDSTDDAVVLIDRATGEKVIKNKGIYNEGSIKQSSSNDWAMETFLLNIDNWNQSNTQAQVARNEFIPAIELESNGKRIPVKSFDPQTGKYTIADEQGNEVEIDRNDPTITEIFPVNNTEQAPVAETSNPTNVVDENGNYDTVGGSPVALEYLLEGGQGSIENAGYFLHGVAAAFPELTQQIEDIRASLGDTLGVNPTLFANSREDVKQQIAELVQQVYGDKGVSILNSLFENANGFVPSIGKRLGAEIEGLTPVSTNTAEAQSGVLTQEEQIDTNIENKEKAGYVPPKNEKGGIKWTEIPDENIKEVLDTTFPAEGRALRFIDMKIGEAKKALTSQKKKKVPTDEVAFNQYEDDLDKAQKAVAKWENIKSIYTTPVEAPAPTTETTSIEQPTETPIANAETTVNEETPITETEVPVEQVEETEAEMVEEIPVDATPVEVSNQSKVVSKEELDTKVSNWGANGVKVNVINSIDEVPSKRVRADIKKGIPVTGWYDTASGEVYVYSPNVTDAVELDKTIIHEVVAHKGLRKLIGEDGYKQFCEKVFDSMPKKAQKVFLGYPNVNGDKAAAADEYIAYLAEKQDLTAEEQAFWDKMIQFFRELFDNALNGIVSKSNITNDDISKLIRMSYANIKNEANQVADTNTEEQSSNEDVADNGVVLENDTTGLDTLIQQGLEEDAVLEGRRSEKIGEIVDKIEEVLPKATPTPPDGGGPRYRTSSEIDKEYPNWMEGTTKESGKKGHSTQVTKTVGTYNKVGAWIEKNLGKDVEILDASSGMGLGTQSLREQGFNIEDVEPYQSAERKQNNPATYSAYADIDKQYDYIISNAVLNVIPDDWRADVLHNMADRMKDGGKMFINTRMAGHEKDIKDKIELDSPQEVLVKTNGKISSYQKFFTPQELKEWVENELGEGYTVEVANEKNSGTKGLAAVVVTKKENPQSDLRDLTTSPSPKVEFNQTAVRTQTKDAAKIMKSVDDLIELSINSKGRNITNPYTIVAYLADALNIAVKNNEGPSKRNKYVLPNGETISVRASTHNTSAETYIRFNYNQDYNLAITFKSKHTQNDFITNEDVRLDEYVYFTEDVRKYNGSVLSDVASSLADFLKTGVYTDRTGLAKVNVSPEGVDPRTNNNYNIRYRIPSTPVEARQRAENIMKSAIEPLAAELGIEVNYVTNESISDVEPGARKKRLSKGWYQDGKVYINLSTQETTDDARETYLHEVVGHYGLRGLLKDQFEPVMRNVFASLTLTQQQSLLEIFADEVEAAEEFLSSMAENDIDPSLVEKVIGFIREALREIGINLDNFTNGDLQYLLWRSKNNLKENAGAIESANLEAKDKEVRYRTLGRPAGYSTNDIEMSWFDRQMHSIQDRMRPVKKIMDEIKALGGYIDEKSDPWSQEFLSASRADSEIRDFKNNRYKPLATAISEAMKVLIEKENIPASEARKMVTDFLYARHAPERNKHICVNEIVGEANKKVNDAIRKLSEAWVLAEVKNRFGKASILSIPYGEIEKIKAEAAKIYNQSLLNSNMETAIRDAAKIAYDNKFKGANATVSNANLSQEQVELLNELNDVMKTKAEAISKETKKDEATGQMVNTANNRSGMSDKEAEKILSKLYTPETAAALDEVSARVKDCTNFTLEKWLQYGLISKEEYDAYQNQYQYYIPLRGWEEKEDIDYTEIPSKQFNMASELVNLNRHAKGRLDKAENPLAYIASLAQSACITGNRNLIRQHAFNMVENNADKIAHLAVIENTYEIYDDQGNVIGYTKKAPSKAMFDKGLVKVMKDKTYEWNKTSSQLGAHRVPVMIDGVRHIVYFKGKIGALAATAINGTGNDTRNIVIQKMAKATRLISSNLTAKNVYFLTKNAMRDLMFGNFAYFVENGFGKGWKLNTHFASAIRTAYNDARGKMPNPNNAKDVQMYNLYQEFKANGGQTGYVQLDSIDSIGKEMEKMIEEAGKNKGVVRGTWNFALELLNNIGAASENAMRFAVYRLERESGASPREAAIKAKQITVNFNQQGKNTKYYSAMYAFFNPAIQGSYRFFNLAYEHPKRFTAAMATLFAAKMASVVFSNMVSGGDDEEKGKTAYDRLSPYVKATNIVIPLGTWTDDGEDKFLCIPLAQSVRGPLSAADGLYDVMMGKKNIGEVAKDYMLFNLGELMPFDIDAIDLTGDKFVPSVVQALSPTAVRPVVEAYVINRDFMGNPIHKETYLRGQDYIPQSQLAFASTPDWLIGTSESINKLAGGDEKRSAEYQIAENGIPYKSHLNTLDINPAKIEHLAKGYFGGMANVFIDIWNTADGAVSEDKDIMLESVPMVNQFVREASSKPGYKTFYEMAEQAQMTINIFSLYKREYAETGAYKELFENKFNSDVIGLYKEYGERVRDMNKALLSAQTKEEKDSITKERDNTVKEAAKIYEQLKEKYGVSK